MPVNDLRSTPKLRGAVVSRQDQNSLCLSFRTIPTKRCLNNSRNTSVTAASTTFGRSVLPNAHALDLIFSQFRVIKPYFARNGQAIGVQISHSQASRQLCERKDPADTNIQNNPAYLDVHSGPLDLI